MLKNDILDVLPLPPSCVLNIFNSRNNTIKTTKEFRISAKLQKSYWCPVENPFQYSTLQGICRTIQGPSMLDLQEQTHLRPSDFQWIFMLCSISFPLGNFLGK